MHPDASQRNPWSRLLSSGVRASPSAASHSLAVKESRPVAMLSAFTMSLMASFLLGADGAISGMGSVVADLHAELFEACQKGDVDGARRINDRLDPSSRCSTRRRSSTCTTG